MVKLKKVFLGGACNKSTWRDELIEGLKIGHFNPLETSWDEASYKREVKERLECDFFLYVVTPKIAGTQSIVAVIEDSIVRPSKVIFCVIREEDSLCFTDEMNKTLSDVGNLVVKNGAKYFEGLDAVRDYLNSMA